MYRPPAYILCVSINNGALAQGLRLRRRTRPADVHRRADGREHAFRGQWPVFRGRRRHRPCSCRRRFERSLAHADVTAAPARQQSRLWWGGPSQGVAGDSTRAEWVGGRAGCEARGVRWRLCIFSDGTEFLGGAVTFSEAKCFKVKISLSRSKFLLRFQMRKLEILTFWAVLTTEDGLLLLSEIKRWCQVLIWWKICFSSSFFVSFFAESIVFEVKDKFELLNQLERTFFEQVSPYDYECAEFLFELMLCCQEVTKGKLDVKKVWLLPWRQFHYFSLLFFETEMQEQVIYAYV